MMFESAALYYETPEKKAKKTDPYQIDSFKLKGKKGNREKGIERGLDEIRRVIDFKDYEEEESYAQDNLVKPSLETKKQTYKPQNLR